MKCDHSQKEYDSGRGETVCKKCGIVLEDQKIIVQESRSFTEEERERTERTGNPIKFSKSKSGLGSYMGSSGNISASTSGHKRSKYFRLNKWNNRVSDHKERKLNDGRDEFRLIFASLDIPNSLKEEAMVLYIRSLEEDLINGRSRNLMCVAIAYIVCRNAGIPRTLKMCSEALDVDSQKLGQYYKYICRELDLDVPRIKPIHILDYYLSETGLTRYSGECRNVIKQLEGFPEVTSKAPRSIVAGVIYYVCHDELDSVTQGRMSRVVGTTEVTIRKTYRAVEQIVENEHI